jgi:hypothetical protein
LYFEPFYPFLEKIDMKEWLCLVHRQDEVEIKCRVML